MLTSPKYVSACRRCGRQRIETGFSDDPVGAAMRKIFDLGYCIECALTMISEGMKNVK